MSATLGVLLHTLNPTLKICMVERLSDVALESSDALNNAGTGHAGYCELNYTPTDAQGHVKIQRALEINAAFELSLEFWASLVERNALASPDTFIQRIPHLSFVWGEENVRFLKKRHQLLQQHHLFEDMRYSEDRHQLLEWMPLVMKQREKNQPLAATYVPYGSDVNFGALTRQLVTQLKNNPNFILLTNTRVTKIRPSSERGWTVDILGKSPNRKIKSRFIFLGAGGAALPLLQKTGIPESLGYGGFPVSGQWLICQNQALIKQHSAKVYGKAAVGAPPMSVPHLDTRMIDGKPALLFGPFAGFTTRFLKTGSSLDLAKSIKPNNLKSLLGAGKNNLDLTKYLVKEVFQSHHQRIEALKAFVPDANPADWKLAKAGQRVQIIKKCDTEWGRLEFGTEIVTSADGSIAALLGASPGASTSVKAMLEVLERCFSAEMQTPSWQNILRDLLPSYGSSLINDASLLRQVRNRNNHILKLDQ